MSKKEMEKMMTKSSFGKRRKKRKVNPLAKKAMQIHHREGISLKRAWIKARKMR